jgi:hypothetical protein
MGPTIHRKRVQGGSMARASVYRTRSLVILLLVCLGAGKGPGTGPEPTISPEIPEGVHMQAGAGGLIAQGETQSHVLQVDEPGLTAFWLMYRSGNLNLSLVSPDGQVFDSTSALGRTDISWEEAPFPFGGVLEHIAFQIAKPGTWTARVTAPRVEEPSGVTPYTVSILAQAAVSMEVEVVEGDSSMIVGDRLVIRATLTKDGRPIRGANVLATVVAPDETRSEVPLPDNGVEPDSVSGDGIYTATSAVTGLPGEYQVLVDASGRAGESDRSFRRNAFTGKLVARSRSEEDLADLLGGRSPGPLEPPIEIRSRLEQNPATSSPTYVYTVSNGSPYPIISFRVGVNARTHRSQLRAVPLGWERRKGVPRTSFEAPSGWKLYYEGDQSSPGSLSWVSSDTTAAISSGHTAEFRIAVPRPDTTYERSAWTALTPSLSGDLYGGPLLRSTEKPSGDPVQRLGRLQITSGDSARSFVVRCSTPPARPTVAILNSRGQAVQFFPPPEKTATEHRVPWDGRDAAHRQVPAGEYFVLVKYGNTERFGRMTVKP